MFNLLRTRFDCKTSIYLVKFSDFFNASDKKRPKQTNLTYSNLILFTQSPAAQAQMTKVNKPNIVFQTLNHIYTKNYKKKSKCRLVSSKIKHRVTL